MVKATPILPLSPGDKSPHFDVNREIAARVFARIETFQTTAPTLAAWRCYAVGQIAAALDAARKGSQ